MTKVVFLGTAGYHPSETRHTACVFLPEYGIVLDAGTGFFRVIGRVETKRLDVLVSHAHLDHVMGITYLLDVLYKHPEIEDVRIYGAEEHLSAIRTHLFFAVLFPVLPNFQMIVVGDEFIVGGIKVKTLPLHHNGNAIGYRLEFPDSKTLAYITDTEVDESYLPLIQDADLLIHECNFSDSMKDRARLTTHSTTSEVFRLAKQGNVKKLALFHFNPLDGADDPSHMEDANERFLGAIVAQDLMEVEF